MGTTFNLSAGYGSGYAFTSPTVEQIIEIARTITPDELLSQAEKLDRKKQIGTLDSLDLDGYLLPYQDIPTDDLRVRITAQQDGLYGLATGGDSPEQWFRYLKEIFQTAFYSLLAQRCFERGFAVSLEIH